MSKKVHDARLGWIPSGFDGRDWAWSEELLANSPPLTIPFPPIVQGSASCCVGAALTSAMEILDARNGEAIELSPLFNYYTARRSPGSTGSVEIRRSLQAATSHGVCARQLHERSRGPFAREDALVRPTDAAKRDARARRLLESNPNTNMLGYYRVDGAARAHKWKTALRKGCPIVFGFYPTQAYAALSGTDDFLVADVSEDVGGREGHAALVVGERAGKFRIRDSQGTEFCDKGYWYLAADVVETGWVVESWALAHISFDT
jgi:hypothetical protein